MPYSFPQPPAEFSGGAVQSGTATFTSALTVGNWVHAVVGCSSASTPTTPVSASVSVWTPIGNATESGTGSQLYHWIGQVTAAGTTIMETLGAVAELGLAAVEISGISGVVLGHSQQGSNGGTGNDIVSSGNAAYALGAAPGALVLGFAWDLQGPIQNPGTGFTGLATGWTNQGASPNAQGRYEHKRVTSGTTTAATFQDTGFDRHLALVAVLAEGTAGGGGLLNQFRRDATTGGMQSLNGGMRG